MKLPRRTEADRRETVIRWGPKIMAERVGLEKAYKRPISRAFPSTTLLEYLLPHNPF
jgi:hypothetical protein